MPPTPAPTIANSKVKPAAMPYIFGKLARAPNLAPDAVTRTIFGPGDDDVAKA